MNYDFTTVMDRRGHDLLATDVIPHEGVTVREGVTAIPMWIADMSFPTAPAVTEAIEERLRFPNFGCMVTVNTRSQISQLTEKNADIISGTGNRFLMLAWESQRHL